MKTGPDVCFPPIAPVAIFTMGMTAEAFPVDSNQSAPDLAGVASRAWLEGFA